MGTPGVAGRRGEKGSSCLGRVTGEREGYSPDLPRAAVLFSGHVESEKKERMPGHIRSSNSSIANHRGDLPWLPK